MSFPSPIVLDASTWLGNDGNWSTFNISVGNPAQSFYVLPSTTASVSWFPTPEGCTNLSFTGFSCAQARGAGNANGTQSPGFTTADSTTWRSVGLYSLLTGQNLFGSYTNLMYGQDSMRLASQTPIVMPSQLIGGITSWDFWIGSLGLGNNPTHFDVLTTDSPSMVQYLKQNNLISSLSYGIFVGAWYRQEAANIIIGGYDDSRLSETRIIVPTAAAQNQGTELRVYVRGLQVTGTIQGTIAFPNQTQNLSMAIDSTASQIWLPSVICDKLATAFNLTYLNDTSLYAIDDATHAKLMQLKPQLTFTISKDGTSASTTSINFPYSAFVAQLGIPFYNSTSPIRYFPIRKAPNDSQLTLGRAFLQEAYLVVDYERGNFTIGQVNHGSARSIVSILPQLASSSNSSSFTTGGIVGIVVGILSLLATTAAGIFLARRRKRRIELAHRETDISLDENATESLVDSQFEQSCFKPIPSALISELPDGQGNPQELETVRTSELPGGQLELRELEASQGHRSVPRAELGVGDLRTSPHNQDDTGGLARTTIIHELPG